MSDKQKYVEAKLRRGSGMSAEKRTWMNAENAKFRDWWATCWNCHKRIEGTIADLQGTCPHCGVSLVSKEDLYGTSST